MTPPRVLVTGATGFVGAWTVARLLEEKGRFRVRVLVRDPARLSRALGPLGIADDAVEVVRGDITDPAAVGAAVVGCGMVVHAAGLFSADTADAARMQHTNVEGTRCVLEAAHAARLDPIVHVSSYLALFPPAGSVQHADDPVTAPRGVYARTKADGERIARALQAAGAPVTCIYPGAIHGPLDPSFGASPAYIAESLCSGRMLVNRGGRVYIDIRDLATVIARTLVPGLGPRRILCGGDYIEDERLFAWLCELTGRDLQALRIPAPLLRALGRLGDLVAALGGPQPQLTWEAACVITRSVPCDNGAALALLGRPFMDMRESLRELLAWMVESGHLDAASAGHAEAPDR